MAQPEQSLLPFVDAHHHLWDLESGSYDWLTAPSAETTRVLGDLGPIQKTYLVADLARDFAGRNVIRSVHVEGGWSGPDPSDETAWLQRQAGDGGFPHAIVAQADLLDPALGRLLERHRAAPNLRGIRMHVQGPELDEQAFLRGFALLRSFDLSFELTVTHDHFNSAAQLARAFPETQIVLGHTGLPAVWTEEYFRDWKQALARLAAEPNVAIKLSGFGMFEHAWTVATLRPWILAAIEAFGPDRCLFGTNWPVDALYSSYGELVGAFRSIIGDFSAAEQRSLLAGNALRIYALEA